MSEQKFEFKTLWRVRIDHVDQNEKPEIPLLLEIVNRFQAERLFEFVCKWKDDLEKIKGVSLYEVTSQPTERQIKAIPPTRPDENETDDPTQTKGD